MKEISWKGELCGEFDLNFVVSCEMAQIKVTQQLEKAQLNHKKRALLEKIV